MAGDLQEWFSNLPVFTRYWFGGTIVLTLLARFGILPMAWLVLSWTRFYYNFDLWRPVTALFFYPLSPQTGFHFLINLYFLYSYSYRLETGSFLGRPADYLFMLLFNWICCVIMGFMMNLPFLMDPMVLSVLYVWCQLNKDMIVSFWFGTQFKAVYLPWVLFGFNMVISGGGIMELVGIIIGHIYYFFTFQYPQEFGGNFWLKTPSFFYDWFPNVRSMGSVHGGETFQRGNVGRGNGRFNLWGGGGQRLGD